MIVFITIIVVVVLLTDYTMMPLFQKSKRHPVNKMHVISSIE